MKSFGKAIFVVLSIICIDILHQEMTPIHWVLFFWLLASAILVLVLVLTAPDESEEPSARQTNPDVLCSCCSVPAGSDNEQIEKSIV